jgi:hypothetical protein
MIDLDEDGVIWANTEGGNMPAIPRPDSLFRKLLLE